MARSARPAPYPTARTCIAGSAPNSAASAVTRAAPVGVTSSPSTSAPVTGTPASSATVAGAGSGIRPWAASTKPRASGSGEHTTRSTPSSSKPVSTPTTSTMVSMPPNSCRWTRSGAVPWDRGLNLAQAAEDGRGAALDGGRDAARLHQGDDLRHVPLGGVIGHPHVDLERADTGPSAPAPPPARSRAGAARPDGCATPPRGRRRRAARRAACRR